MATTKLDSLDVFTCAKAANHAYLKEPLIKKIYKNGEWSFIKFFENATWSTEAFLIHNISRKRALLAFRGSQELADFLFDIVSILPPLGKEKPQVNLMFNKLWESIKSDVLSEIAKLDGQYPGTRFYITGHSLGGALALACLDDISRILRFCIDRPIINTFGTPPIGNLPWVKLMNDKSHCATYVDHNDTLISLASKLIKNNPLGNYVDNPNPMSPKLGSGHSILSYANNMDIKEPAIELSPHFYYRSLTQVLLVLHLGTCKGFAIEDIVSLEPSLLYGEREIFSTGCRLIGYDLVNDSESNNMDGSKGYLFANSTVILEVDVSKVSLVDFMISPFKEKIHLGFWKLNPGIKIGIKGLEVIVEGVPIHFDGADYGTYELPKMTNAISFNLKSKPFSRLIHRSEAVLGDNNGTWKKDAYYSNRAATGLTVRDQGRYEIVNLAMIYFENGGYNETDYTCDNHAGERTAHMHLSITNIDVGVGSSGIAAIKVHYIDGTSKIMGTNGNVSKWVSAKIPSNSIVVGLQGKETNSWGLVDLKVIYFVE